MYWTRRHNVVVHVRVIIVGLVTCADSGMRPTSLELKSPSRQKVPIGTSGVWSHYGHIYRQTTSY